MLLKFKILTVDDSMFNIMLLNSKIWAYKLYHNKCEMKLKGINLHG